MTTHGGGATSVSTRPGALPALAPNDNVEADINLRDRTKQSSRRSSSWWDALSSRRLNTTLSPQEEVARRERIKSCARRCAGTALAIVALATAGWSAVYLVSDEIFGAGDGFKSLLGNSDEGKRHLALPGQGVLREEEGGMAPNYAPSPAPTSRQW